MKSLVRKDLIYPELCYQIIGKLFVVWGKLGFGHKEKIYQNAIEQELKDSEINYERELPVRIKYNDNLIGMYYFDFLVENKIVLETKVRNYFAKKDIEQLYSYLKAKNLKLGIIAHFTNSGVKFKRIVNINNNS